MYDGSRHWTHDMVVAMKGIDLEVVNTKQILVSGEWVADLQRLNGLLNGDTKISGMHRSLPVPFIQSLMITWDEKPHSLIGIPSGSE